MLATFSHIFMIMFGFFNLSEHPIHISRTEVNYSSKDKEMQVAAKIYIDDFESAIKASTKKDIKMFSPKEDIGADQIIETYINQKLSIHVDGKKAKLELIGKESSEDHLAVWVYLSAKFPQIPSSMAIDCRYLYEIYNDQRNMVEIAIDGRKKKFFVLDANKPSESFKI